MGGNKKNLRMNTAKNRQVSDDEKAQKVARTAIITVAVVAVLFAAAIFLNSDYLRKNLTCVKIGGVKYTITDFNYSYQNLYAQYYSSMSSASSDLTSALLPDSGTSLKSQIYDEDTGKTWADFFEEMTLAQMEEDNKILVEALAAGYELTEEDTATIDEELETIQTTAYTYGYTDLDVYLEAMYGKGMDEEAFRSAIERAQLIISYTDYVNESFTYTDDEIEAFYDENSDKLDTFTYRYIHIAAADVEESDYADEADYEAAEEAAIDDTEAQAIAYAESITDEASFIEAARDYDPESYAEDDDSLRVYQGELLGSTYGDWLKEDGRAEGDVSTFRSTNGTYVVYYIDRDDNHYSTVNAQMILCTPETINADDYAEDETTEAYDAAVEAADVAAEELANDLYAALEASDDAQAEIVEQYEFYTGTTQIDDDYSGLFEQVYREQLDDAVSEWLFDEARQEGDYTVVYSEDTGYYLVYFVSTDEMYSTILADTDMREDDLQAWKDALEVFEAKVTWVMTLAQ